MRMERILVTGAVGQIGSELTPELRRRYGDSHVVAMAHRTAPRQELQDGGPLVWCDVTDREALEKTQQSDGAVGLLRNEETETENTVVSMVSSDSRFLFTVVTRHRDEDLQAKLRPVRVQR